MRLRNYRDLFISATGKLHFRMLAVLLAVSALFLIYLFTVRHSNVTNKFEVPGKTPTTALGVPQDQLVTSTQIAQTSDNTQVPLLPVVNAAADSNAAPDVYTGYTPPQAWTCNRIFTTNRFTQTYDRNYELTRYLQANGWGQFYNLSAYGDSLENQIAYVFSNFGPFGDGDLIYFQVSGSAWFETLTDARVNELKSAMSSGATVVIETEFAGFTDFDAYPNTLFTRLGSTVRKDMGRYYVLSNDPYILQPWNLAYWFTTAAWDETVGSGGSVTMATSNFFGGSTARGLYFTQEGNNYALTAEENYGTGRLRINGDTSNTNDDGYWYYGGNDWHMLKFQSVLLSCADHTGLPLTPAPTPTSTPTPVLTTTPSPTPTPEPDAVCQVDPHLSVDIYFGPTDQNNNTDVTYTVRFDSTSGSYIGQPLGIRSIQSHSMEGPGYVAGPYNSAPVGSDYAVSHPYPSDILELGTNWKAILDPTYASVSFDAVFNIPQNEHYIWVSYLVGDLNQPWLYSACDINTYLPTPTPTVTPTPTLTPTPAPLHLTGTVFTDENNNAAFDPGEPGIPGATVYIDVDYSHTKTPGDVETVTGTNGDFTFDYDTPPYIYVYLFADIPAGFVQTLPLPNYVSPFNGERLYSFTQNSCGNPCRNLDFGFIQNNPSPSPTQTPTPTLTPTPVPDTIPPVIDPMTGPADGSTIDFSSFCFPMIVTDNISVYPNIWVQYAFDSMIYGGWTTDVAPCYQNVPDGVHTFTVRAIDEAGNVSEPILRTFTVLTQPSPTPTPSDTPTPTITPSPTETPTPTLTPSPTVTPSVTPTETPTPTLTPSPTQSPTPTETPTPTLTPSPSPIPVPDHAVLSPLDFSIGSGEACGRVDITVKLLDSLGNEITEGIESVDWSISSLSSVGTFQDITGRTARFQPLHSGVAHITVIIRYAGQSYPVSTDATVTGDTCRPSGNNSSSDNSGSSNATPPVCSDTKPVGKPHLSITRTEQTQVFLTWSDEGKPITHYLLTYGTKSGAEEYGNPDIGTSSMYTVKDLAPGKDYYFRIKPVNGCMPGDYSNEVSTAGILSAAFTGTEEGETNVKGASAELSPTPIPPSGQPLAAKTCADPWWKYLLLAADLILLVASRGFYRTGNRRTSWVVNLGMVFSALIFTLYFCNWAIWILVLLAGYLIHRLSVSR